MSAVMSRGVLEPQACNFIKKESLAQVFSREFCEVFKNTFFTEHLSTTASVFRTQTNIYDEDFVQKLLTAFSSYK